MIISAFVHRVYAIAIAGVVVGPGFVFGEVDCSENLTGALLLGDAGLDGLDDGGQKDLLAF
jgi:hypothetical protein